MLRQLRLTIAGCVLSAVLGTVLAVVFLQGQTDLAITLGAVLALLLGALPPMPPTPTHDAETLEQIRALWKGICDGTITIDPNDPTHLVCPAGDLSWSRNAKFDVKCLRIRQCYKLIYDEWVVDARRTVELISGTSGIGKSTYIWYVLFRQMEEYRNDPSKGHRQFMWQTQGENEGTYWLHTSGTCDVLVSATDAMGEPDLYIVDIGDQFSPHPDLYPYPFKKRRLLVASFMSEKIGLRPLARMGIVPKNTATMPIWTLEEMEPTAQRIFGNTYDATRLKALHVIFGGSLNHCLRSFPTTPSCALRTQYSRARVETIALLKTSKTLRDAKLPDTVGNVLKEEGVVHAFKKVVPVFSGSTHYPDLRHAGSVLGHLHSSPPYRGETSRVASIFCECYIAKYRTAEDAYLPALFSMIGMSTGGGLHEHRGHRILPTAKRAVPIRYLNANGRPATMDFPDRKTVLFASVTEIKSMPDKAYGRPFAGNFAVIDFVIQPNILGKFFVSSTHALDKKTRPKFVEQRKQLKEKDLSKHLFLWVVHDDATFKAFKTQSGFFTGAQSGQDAITQAVIKVPW